MYIATNSKHLQRIKRHNRIRLAIYAAVFTLYIYIIGYGGYLIINRVAGN